jgi:tetratricopeptide (TPR) repeat protein
MPESDLNDTQPSTSLGDTKADLPAGETQPDLPSQPEGRKFPGWLVFLVVFLLIVIGGLAGYGSGIGRRMQARATQLAGQLQQQLNDCLHFMDIGQYEVARQQCEYVLQNDPNFPGAQAAYTELLLRIQISPTPTFTQTPTITPTPDLRGAEAIFNTALQYLKASDWDNTLQNLDSLRKVDPTYRAAEVDGMYYTAFRMRGVAKINAVCDTVNLEGGISDITHAEQFGPLDAFSDGLRNYARMYIIGASFWDQDWAQAQGVFAEVMAGFPNMMDSSCETATERWWYATIQYARQLQNTGDACGAASQLESAFSLSTTQNEQYYPYATANYLVCNPAAGWSPTPSFTPSETPTPTSP